MRLTFLGTSCMVPTKDRNHASILFSHGSENILFDCGEGTQRQLKIANFSLMKITKIVISHWHGDHVLGIPGLLQSMAAGLNADKKLIIYGPKGTKKRIKKMFETFIFDNKLDLSITEYKKDNQKIIENNDFIVESFLLDHGVETHGFRIAEKDRKRINMNYVNKIGIPNGPLLGKLQQGKDIDFNGKKILSEDATYIVKGKVIGLINDTLLCDNCIKIAKNTDLLISEAAYDSSLEKKAIEYKHMTARQAAQLASQNNVKKLVLYHFSQRYKTIEIILNDAKDIFENTIAAFDFMKIKV